MKHLHKDLQRLMRPLVLSQLECDVVHPSIIGLSILQQHSMYTTEPSNRNKPWGTAKSCEASLQNAGLRHALLPCKWMKIQDLLQGLCYFYKALEFSWFMFYPSYRPVFFKWDFFFLNNYNLYTANHPTYTCFLGEKLKICTLRNSCPIYSYYYYTANCSVR